MNEVSKFLIEHHHCTKLTCTTCGGILAFLMDFSTWNKTEAVNLTRSIQNLTPYDLADIQDWPVFLEQILLQLPESDRENCVYPYWMKHFGISMDYDFFAIRNFPANSFDPLRDENWVRQLIEFVENNDYEHFGKPLLRFMGGRIHEYPEFDSALKIARERTLIRRELENITKQERERLIANEKAKHRDELLIKENRKIELIQHYSHIDPRTRLIEILEDPSIPLSLVPEEWAIIPDVLMDGMTSTELTHLTKLLTSKIRKRERSQWKELRNHLFKMRQKVYNVEKGFSD